MFKILAGERQMDQTEVEAETERMPKSNLAQQVAVTVFIHIKGSLHMIISINIDEE